MHCFVVLGTVRHSTNVHPLDINEIGVPILCRLLSPAGDAIACLISHHLCVICCSALLR